MTRELTDTDIQRALLDPASVFSRPADVLAVDGVPDSVKVDLLRRWEYDALELQVAEEEGLRGDGGGLLLDEILAGLRSLGAARDTEHSPTTKQGGL